MKNEKKKKNVKYTIDISNELFRPTAEKYLVIDLFCAAAESKSKLHLWMGKHWNKWKKKVKKKERKNRMNDRINFHVYMYLVTVTKTYNRTDNNFNLVKCLIFRKRKLRVCVLLLAFCFVCLFKSLPSTSNIFFISLLFLFFIVVQRKVFAHKTDKCKAIGIN